MSVMGLMGPECETFAILEMVRSTLRERKNWRSQVSKSVWFTLCLLMFVRVWNLIAQSSNRQNPKFTYIDPLRLNLVMIGWKYLRFPRRGWRFKRTFLTQKCRKFWKIHFWPKLDSQWQIMVMNALSSICRLYSAENQLIWCKIAIFDKIRSKMMENCVLERMATVVGLQSGSNQIKIWAIHSAVSADEFLLKTGSCDLRFPRTGWRFKRTFLTQKCRKFGKNPFLTEIGFPMTANGHECI